MKKNKFAKKTDLDIMPLISENRSYVFASRETANRKIEQLKSRYTYEDTKIKQPENIVIWIEGYDISVSDKIKGIIGNFVEVSVLETEEKGTTLFTLLAQKVIRKQAEIYPKGVEMKFNFPNRNHRFLKEISTGKTYDNEVQPRSRLLNLHIEFPIATIPVNQDKLLLSVYDKKSHSRFNPSPLTKIILEVNETEKGMYYIAENPNPIKGVLPERKHRVSLQPLSSYRD